jgi:hypothetical protein
MEIPSSTIYLKKVDGLTSATLIRLAESMKSKKYNKESGFGFSVDYCDSSQIEGYFILDVPMFTTDFDIEKLIITKTKVVKKSIIKFYIDLECHTLAIFSDKKNISPLISEISKQSNFSLEIDDVFFEPDYVIKELEAKGIEYQIKKMRIKDYSLNENCIGSFFVTVFGNQEGKKLIYKYSSQITYLGLGLNMNDNVISVGFYQTGAVRIYTKIEDFSEFMLLITKALIDE